MNINPSSLNDKSYINTYCQAALIITPFQALSVTRQLPVARDIVRNKLHVDGNHKRVETDIGVDPMGMSLCYNVETMKFTVEEHEDDYEKYRVNHVTFITPRNIIYSDDKNNRKQGDVLVWGDEFETSFYYVDFDRTVKYISNRNGFTIGNNEGKTLDCETDEQGRLIRTKSHDNNITLYHYDDNDNIIKTEKYELNSLICTEEFEYDELGNMVLEKKLGKDSNSDVHVNRVIEHEYIYNDDILVKYYKTVTDN